MPKKIAFVVVPLLCLVSSALAVWAFAKPTVVQVEVPEPIVVRELEAVEKHIGELLGGGDKSPVDRRTIEKTIEGFLPDSPDADSPETKRENGPPRDVMAAFLEAGKRKDSKKLLAFFPRTKTWRLKNAPSQPSNTKEQVSFEELTKDFQAKGPWYDFFFNPSDESDNFANFNESPADWKRGSKNSFVHEGEWGDSTPRVVWRLEGDRWTIAEIVFSPV